MAPLDRIRTLQRFVRQEGLATAALRIMAAVAGLVYRSETAYILARPTTVSETAICPEGVAISLLDETRADGLAAVSYSDRADIIRRLRHGQKCIIAEIGGRIAHYSWLTPQSEYAGEIEMTVPVRNGEAYLYNCRTLAWARGKGIFPAVIARALEEAGKSGASSLLALVSKNNSPSLKAFAKMQFDAREEIRLVRYLNRRTHLHKKAGPT